MFSLYNISLLFLSLFIARNHANRELTASSEMLLWRPVNETFKGISLVQEAFVLVPADWEDPDSPLIPINLKKFTKSQQNNNTTTVNDSSSVNIWYVPGGPGQSSGTLEVMLPVFLRGIPDGSSLYAFDHRGLGKSTPLASEREKALLEEYPKDPKLLQTILQRKQEKLGILTPLTRTLRVENVARDLIKAVSLVNQESTAQTSNYLVGISYGTMVSRRALQLAPEGLFEAVLLDGLAPVENIEISNESDQIIQEICDLLPACKEKLHGFDGSGKMAVRQIIPRIIAESAKSVNSCTAYFIKTFAGQKSLCYAMHDLMNASLTQGRTAVKVASLRILLEMLNCKDVESFRELFDTINDILTGPKRSVNQIQGMIVASTVGDPKPASSDHKAALSSDELVFEVVSALERYNVTETAVNICYNRKHRLNGDDGSSCPARLFDPCKFFQMTYKRKMALSKIYGQLPPISLKDPMVQVPKTRILVLAGNFDFNTPAWMSRQLAYQYTRGQSVKYHEFFGYGHSMFGSSDCDNEILRDFLDGKDRTSPCALKWNLRNMWTVNNLFNSTLSGLNQFIKTH